MTSVIAIGSGATVLFSTTGPQAGSPSASIGAPGFSQYLISQLLTTTAAAPGNTTVLTLTMQYNET